MRNTMRRRTFLQGVGAGVGFATLGVPMFARAGKFIANFILPRVSEMSGPYQMFGQLLPEHLAKKTELNGTSFGLEVPKTVHSEIWSKLN